MLLLIYNGREYDLIMNSWTDIFRILVFWAMNASMLAAAGTLARRLKPRDSLSFWASTIVIYFPLICAGLTLFGLFGLIRLSVIGPISLLPGAYLLLRRLYQKKPLFDFENARDKDKFLGRAFLWMLALAVIFLFAVRLWYPEFEHDPLTFQLYFPGQWLAQARLDLIATPFGDNSRAYEPSNASLYCLWLILPIHGDLFAQFGQMPFLILALISLIGISARLGLKSPWHYLPAIFFACTPIVFSQAGSAENDLALTAAFLAFIYFALGLSDEPDSTEDLLAALALGMLVGTKYLGLTLLVVLIPIILYVLVMLFRKSRIDFSRVMLWLVLIFLVGGLWYLRNLALTGNPLYPLKVMLGGKVLLSGAYSAETMRNWVFHQEGFDALKGVLDLLLSRMMLFTLLGSMILGLLLCLRRKAGLSRFLIAYLCVLPVLVHLINWYVVPFQVHRFWLPAFAVAFLAFAVVIKSFPPAGYLYICLLIIELYLQSEPEPGIMWHIHVYECALIFGLVLSAMKARRKVFLGLISLAVLFSFIAAHDYISRRAEHFNKEWEFGDAWNYLCELQGPIRVAYSGSNVPYPLLGPRLENHVQYVNINSGAGWNFHDYDRRFRTAKNWPEPDTPEPALYRLERNITAWWDNLCEAKMDYLFITRVGRNALVNIAHDKDGWPVESWWAIEHPEVFRMVYEDRLVRIFRIDREADPSFSKSEKQTLIRPVDALAVYDKHPEALIKFFPLAGKVIEEYQK